MVKENKKMGRSELSLLERIRGRVEDYARIARHDFIDDSHLFFAVIGEGGLAEEVLKEFGVSKRKLMDFVFEPPCYYQSSFLSKGPTEFRSSVEKVLLESEKYAKSLNQALNTGHVLYACLEREDTVPNITIEHGFGVSLKDMRAYIDNKLRGEINRN